MADIVIISHVTEACTVTFSDPQLALAWMRVLAGQIPAEAYAALMKVLNPGNADLLNNVREMISACLGQDA